MTSYRTALILAASRLFLAVDYTSSSWVRPVSVVSAECRSQPFPDAVEPACSANDVANAGAIFDSNGEVYFRAASAGKKEYFFEYDLGAPYVVDTFAASGTSTLHAGRSTQAAQNGVAP